MCIRDRALACDCEVVGLDYRLAPEHPYPAAVEDAVATYQYLAKQFPSNNIMIAGDSAGGGLTAACLLTLKDQGLPQPACATLISPWLDLTCSTASVQGKLSEFKETAAWYIGGGDAESPGISPLFGKLQGLPPLLIQVAGLEDMRDEAIQFAELAEQADVTVRLSAVHEAFHVYQMFDQLPEAREALSEIGEFFKAHI